MKDNIWPCKLTLRPYRVFVFVSRVSQQQTHGGKNITFINTTCRFEWKISTSCGRKWLQRFRVSLVFVSWDVILYVFGKLCVFSLGDSGWFGSSNVIFSMDGRQLGCRFSKITGTVSVSARCKTPAVFTLLRTFYSLLFLFFWLFATKIMMMIMCSI